MIVRSPLADVAVPDVPLHDFVLALATERAAHPALVDGPSGRELTYGALQSGVGRVAAGLAARGIRPGDVVALLVPNVPEYALAFHGTLAAGGTVTTISSLATPDDITVQLRDAGARLLITIDAFLPHAAPAARAAGVDAIHVLDHAGRELPFRALLASDAPAPAVRIDPASHVAALPYSSGTTGLPKGVMLSHRNLVANIVQMGAVQRITADDRIVAVLPFFHIYGMTVVMNLGLSRGATMVTMPKFEFEPFLQLLERYRITRAFLAPPAIVLLAKHPAVAEYDLSSLRIVFSGAAPLDAELQAACAARIGCAVMQGYGMTEASPVSHATPDDPDANRPGAVGPLVPGTEARIVDVATGATLGVGQDGEIHVRGPQVMLGYLHNAEATAATLDGEGWLHTGDIGHVDADGYFTIVDRLKELIKYKGYQVPPAELEALLLTHPAVADAAVIGVPHDDVGEVPKAFVVLKAPATHDELIGYVAERVSPYKRVRMVEVVETIPKSASGKILRRVLKARELAHRA